MTIEQACAHLQISRATFWRKKYKVHCRVGSRPRYRLEDLTNASEATPAPVLAIDAGLLVAKGFEHMTVDEWHAADRATRMLRQRAHLSDPYADD